MRSTPFSFATLMAIAAMGSAGVPAHAGVAPGAKGQSRRGMKHVIGPATNWPSGKIHKRRSHYPDGQCAKFPKQRKHKQRQHLLRDEHGAFTLTGSTAPEATRRVWLAGISAQRGY